jgi:hypothetical protein
MAALLNGLFDGLRHLQLPAAKLVGRMRLGQDAAGREKLMQ